MEYIALYIRPHKRCQYKKNFNCFWCVLLIWKCLQTCHLPPSRLPFYWTPLFFVILGYFLFCHPRTLFSPVMFGLVSSSVMFGLFLPLSSSGLTRGSPLQIPVSSTGMTNKELSLPRLFFLCHIRAAPNISFVDSPVKHTLSVIVGLDPAI